MKAESEGSAQPEARTCPVCGTKFFATADREFCPVCILHRATSGESTATGESSSISEPAASAEEADGGAQVRRFENYEVMLDENGRLIELGRGAMGVTYKALDVDLRCPVTLKVISERYLGDESARLRFLREARAAPEVRHTDVASVLHLGRAGSSRFADQHRLSLRSRQIPYRMGVKTIKIQNAGKGLKSLANDEEENTGYVSTGHVNPCLPPIYTFVALATRVQAVTTLRKSFSR